MKQPTTIKTFADEDAADRYMRMKNRANRMSGWLWVVTDGPDGGYAVIDIRTATDGAFLYRWAA